MLIMTIGGDYRLHNDAINFHWFVSVSVHHLNKFSVFISINCTKTKDDIQLVMSVMSENEYSIPVWNSV